MESEKLPNLPAVSVLNDADLLYLVQANVSKKITALQLQSLFAKVPSAAILGVGTDSNAAAGKIGEVISLYVSPLDGVDLPDTTPTSIGMITLTPGDWEITGFLNVQQTGATYSTFVGGYAFDGITNLGSVPFSYILDNMVYAGTDFTVTLVMPTWRQKVQAATTLTVDLGAYVGLPSGALNISGSFCSANAVIRRYG